MEFFDFYYFVPHVLVLVAIGGLIIGRVFFRTIGLKTRYLWNYLVMGWAFILTLLLSSWLIAGLITFNTRWIEAGILFSFYIVFIALGNHRFRG